MFKMVRPRLGPSTIQMTADTDGHFFPSGADGGELAEAERPPLGIEHGSFDHQL